MKEIIMIADRVLIEPESDDQPTDAGLYLPQGVKEKEKVNVGRVIKTGPGYPVPDPSVVEEEPWLKGKKMKYFPLQAQAGDICIYLREQAVEVSYERKKYVVVSHSAIIMLIREIIPSSLDKLENI